MPRLKSAIIAGVAGGIVGAAVGFYVRQIATGISYEGFPAYAGAAAFLCAAGFWWLILERRKIYTWRRGALAGALAGIFGHYLCWYLLILAQDICFWGWQGCTGSLGEPPVDPLNGLLAAGVYSAFSLFFLGWLTVPAGTLLAGLLGAWYRAHPS